MKRLILALAAVVMLVSGDAWGATCTTASDVTMSAIGTVVSGTWVSGCSPPTAADTFVADGYKLTITGNWTQNAGAGLGINLKNGGSLDVSVATTAITVSTGDDGINTRVGGLVTPNTGGTLTLRGKYLSHRQSPAVLYDSPTEEMTSDGYTHTWQVGNILPCSDGAGAASDCVTYPYYVEFTYPANVWDTPNGRADRYLDTSIAAINAGAGENVDVACMWDVNAGDAYSLPEDGFCYRIVSTVSTGDNYRITLDVRQGTWASPGLRSHAWRGYHAIVLKSAVQLGQHTIQTDVATAGEITADDDFAGRYVRCQDSDGIWEPNSYKILSTTDDATGDYIRFAAVDEGGTGLLHDYAAGTACVIGYGFQRGEAFFIMRPVLVTSSQATPADDVKYEGGYIEVAGMDVDIAALVHYQVRNGLSVISSTNPSVVDVWERDPWGGNTPVMFRWIDVTGLTANRLSITGAAPNSFPSWSLGQECSDGGNNPSFRCARHHGMQFYGVTTSTVDTYSARHLGDDMIVLQDFNTPSSWLTGEFLGFTQTVSPTSQIISTTIKHVHAQYSSTYGGSGSLIDWYTSQASGVRITDAVCDDCTARDADSAAFNPASGYADTPIECGGTMSRVVLWSILGGGIGSGTGGGGDPWGDRACYTDVYANWIPVNATLLYSAAERMDRFAIFNVNHTASSSAFIYSGVPVWKNGFFAKGYLEKTNPSFFQLRDPDNSVMKLNDVAILDYTTGSVGSIVGAMLYSADTSTAALSGNSIEGVTVGYTSRTPVSARQNTAFNWNAYVAAGSNLRIGDLHMAGMNATAAQIFSASAAFATGLTVVSPLCWTGSVISATGTELGSAPGAALLSAGIRMVHSAAASPLGPGSAPTGDLQELAGCGASRLAGLNRQSWALSKSGLRPVNLGGYINQGGGGSRTVY